MSPDGPSYPPDASAQTFLLTVRGTPVPATVEEARTVHNATAGAPPSVAGAQALGDLSHNVFVDASNGAGGDLLFIDYWNSLSGLGRFFTDPAVQESAGQLFSTREGTVWSGTDTFGDFHLAAPSGRSPGRPSSRRTPTPGSRGRSSPTATSRTSTPRSPRPAPRSTASGGR